MKAKTYDSESGLHASMTSVVCKVALHSGVEVNEASLMKSFQRLCPVDECSALQR